MSTAAETLAAYERWAPLYPPIAHNPLMRAEQAAMLQLWPNVSGMSVLDLACGTGRYTRMLSDAGAARVIALDFCLPMLKQVPSGSRVCAGMTQLPFPDASFDAVISGLALAHATSVELWMHEAARVLRSGGTLLYSDFHPEAARAGLTRSFKDLDEQSVSVPHTDYPVAIQLQAAGDAGLDVETVHEIRIGRELRETFAGSEDFYRRFDGLAIAVIVRAHK
jgi:malonyl-CoA O-methyltransferase